MKSIANKIVDSLFLSPIATSIIEDTATFENRVNLKAGGGVAINYQVSKVDVEKVQKMQKLLKDLFGPMLYRLEPQSTNNFRLAHVCGTCRMGEDPLTSVTDRFGKVHYSENLWIADASVFPSSTGKNPGLSIAAHSLRMANQMVLQESNLNVTRQA
jgi:choline dehydrogenase-like flavoprotein